MDSCKIFKWKTVFGVPAREYNISFINIAYKLQSAIHSPRLVFAAYMNRISSTLDRALTAMTWEILTRVRIPLELLTFTIIQTPLHSLYTNASRICNALSEISLRIKPTHAKFE